MGMMIIRHKVRDYGQWRPMFDEHVAKQKEAGLSNPRVYHSADSNKREIVVVFDTENTKKAKDFAASAPPQGSHDEGWGGGPANNLFPGINRLRTPASVVQEEPGLPNRHLAAGYDATC